MAGRSEGEVLENSISPCLRCDRLVQLLSGFVDEVKAKSHDCKQIEEKLMQTLNKLIADPSCHILQTANSTLGQGRNIVDQDRQNNGNSCVPVSLPSEDTSDYGTGNNFTSSSPSRDTTSASPEASQPLHIKSVKTDADDSSNGKASKPESILRVAKSDTQTISKSDTQTIAKSDTGCMSSLSQGDATTENLAGIEANVQNWMEPGATPISEEVYSLSEAEDGRGVNSRNEELGHSVTVNTTFEDDEFLSKGLQDEPIAGGLIVEEVPCEVSEPEGNGYEAEDPSLSQNDDGLFGPSDPAIPKGQISTSSPSEAKSSFQSVRSNHSSSEPLSGSQDSIVTSVSSSSGNAQSHAQVSTSLLRIQTVHFPQPLSHPQPCTDISPVYSPGIHFDTEELNVILHPVQETGDADVLVLLQELNVDIRE